MAARGRLRQWQAFRADMESAPTVTPFFDSLKPFFG